MRNIDSLRNASQFDRVFHARRSMANHYLVMYQAEGTGKLGIVVSKKVGNSIVRHRTTRLIREAYRLNKEKIRTDRDIIVIAREGAKEQGFIVIEDAFLNLLRRHKLML